MSELSDQVSKHFKPRGELYELRHRLAQVMNEEEWKKFRSVSKAFDDARTYTKRAYELDYDQRFDEARQQLINEAGSVSRRFVPKFMGADNFDKSKINQRAKSIVQHNHATDMALLDQQECDVLRTMIESSEVRFVEKEVPRKDFQKAVDRRTGQDRRVRSWNR